MVELSIVMVRRIYSVEQSHCFTVFAAIVMGYRICYVAFATCFFSVQG